MLAIWSLVPLPFLNQACTSGSSPFHTKSLQLFPTLCNPMDWSLPVSSVLEILRARILEWVVVPLLWSRGSSWPRDRTHVPCSSRIVGGFFTPEPLGKPILDSVVVQSPNCVWLFVIPRTAAHQASLSLTISQSLPKFMFIASLMTSSHLSSSDTLFSICPQSFPASGIFPMSHLFTSDDQNTGASASASVFPVNIQGSPTLRLTGLISLLSMGLSGVSPAPQFKGINSSVLCLLYDPALTTVLEHWEDHSLDYMDLCWQSNVSAFQHTV